MISWIKKNIWMIIGSVTLVVVFPILLNYLVFSWRAPGVNGDWMDFLGSYLGAIIGVIVVYTTVLMQLNAQNKVSNEERTFQVRPYLRAETIENISYELEQINFSPLTPSDDHISPELSNNLGYGQFKLSNIGLGTAIDIQFRVDTYMHRYTYNNSALLVKEESGFHITTFLYNTKEFQLIVLYCDMLGNSYKQKIDFSTQDIDSGGYCLQVKKTHPPELQQILVEAP
ncbi:hypothetical protein [Paenibacillus sp. AN1007]|uniref:SMODS-associating 2TM beta-strand rich effector domain-containing protein n=1 Tax=Paenibacillus sp. AN1007 TaxID=3151385 RepID=A0AAU8NHY5_9BACL